MAKNRKVQRKEIKRLRRELKQATRQANELIFKYEPQRLDPKTRRQLAADLEGGKLPAARADDDAGWRMLRSGPGPIDRDWEDLSQSYGDVLDAWRLNGWVRQAVTLTRVNVIGDGITVSSNDPDEQKFIERFWDHEENQMALRLGPWCDEWTRAGEVYPILFTNKIDGMSQVRAIPASSIRDIETDAADYEKELAYGEMIAGRIELKWWKSRRTAKTFSMRDDNRQRRPEPMMLHYPVNRVIGATRGEGDLEPLLPWAQRYTDWLKGRILSNKIRNLSAMLIIKILDANQVKAKQDEYDARPPRGEGEVLVIGPDEEVQLLSANIEASEAAADGKAIRLAMATAVNLSLVHFGEGDTANLSTTVSMDDRTFRFYRERQEMICMHLADLVFQAYKRYRIVTGAPLADDYKHQIEAKAADISRSDNQELATAAKELIAGLVEIRRALGLGPKFDELALSLALKFAGEVLPADDIKAMLAEASSERGNNGNENGNGAGELHSAAVTNSIGVGRRNGTA